GTFPNAVTDWLNHNIKKQCIPHTYTSFIMNMLSQRSTRLRFVNFTSALIRLTNRIGQGCPMLMVVYIIYNADLINLARGSHESSIGYVNNSTLIA
ncbi:hypothetical protein BDQ12DRAFT_569441, partial [Crucibulum laeve]